MYVSRKEKTSFSSPLNGFSSKNLKKIKDKKPKQLKTI